MAQGYSRQCRRWRAYARAAARMLFSRAHAKPATRCADASGGPLVVWTSNMRKYRLPRLETRPRIATALTPGTGPPPPSFSWPTPGRLDRYGADWLHLWLREPFVSRAGESPGARLPDFAVRLGKVSLSRVCHPRTSPVSDMRVVRHGLFCWTPFRDSDSVARKQKVLRFGEE
jgi:hypothetical protein